MTAASNKITGSALNFLMQNKSPPHGSLQDNTNSRSHLQPLIQGLTRFNWRVTTDSFWPRSSFPFSVPGPCFSPQFRETVDALIMDTFFFKLKTKFHFGEVKEKATQLARYKTHINSSLLLLFSRPLTLPRSQFKNLCILTNRWHHQDASRKPGW